MSLVPACHDGMLVLVHVLKYQYVPSETPRGFGEARARRRLGWVLAPRECIHPRPPHRVCGHESLTTRPRALRSFIISRQRLPRGHSNDHFITLVCACRCATAARRYLSPAPSGGHDRSQPYGEIQGSGGVLHAQGRARTRAQQRLHPEVGLSTALFGCS